VQQQQLVYHCDVLLSSLKNLPLKHWLRLYLEMKEGTSYQMTTMTMTTMTMTTMTMTTMMMTTMMSMKIAMTM
jgi:hypothetical protein